MFTDLAGFTTLTRQDETSTLRLLHEHRALVRPLVARFSGREVKTIGDGFLVAFDSALNAMLCALEIQRRAAEWASETEQLRPQVRIGLHVGDVVDEDGDILGDAVNVASRIEPLADAGGIAVSGPVYDQVHGKVPAGFEKLASPRLKGVDAPPDVYRVVVAGPGETVPGRQVPPGRVAVLPFASISPDPNDAYLADGLTEELTSALSQLGGLRVIARSSVDVYRSRPKPAKEIGAELNVRSLLEGSVRRVGRQLRVTAKLIDAASQEQLWSQTYDRALDDVLTVQSEIARHVAETLKVKVLESEERRLRAKPTGVTESYLAYLKGRGLLRSVEPERLAEAKREFEEALRLDPRNSRACSGLADAVYRAAWVSDPPHAQLKAALRTARELVSTALLLDPNASEAHASLGHILDELHEFAAADRAFRASIGLNPSYAPAHEWYGRLLLERGQLEDAVTEYRLAAQADPLSPGIRFGLASLYLELGREREANEELAALARLEPDGMFAHLIAFERCRRTQDPVGLRREAAWLGAQSPPRTRSARDAYWQGLCHAASGEPELALADVETLERAGRPVEAPGHEWVPGAAAEIYAQLGRLDEAFRSLGAALAVEEISFARWWVGAGLEPARSDPRFRQLLKQAGLA
jgi:adenylate cyclase